MPAMFILEYLNPDGSVASAHLISESDCLSLHFHYPEMRIRGLQPDGLF